MFSRLATFLFDPLARAVDDEGDVAAGRSRISARAAGERAILRVVDAEHDLQRRIILLGEGTEILVKPRLGAVQRLQDRDRRLDPAATGKRRDGQSAGPPQPPPARYAQLGNSTMAMAKISVHE